MSFLQISTSFLIMAVAFVKISANDGEIFASASKDTDYGLKHSDKRQDNFRVPVEMPFDPKFWPARGRRGGSGNERNFQGKNCGGRHSLNGNEFGCREESQNEKLKDVDAFESYSQFPVRSELPQTGNNCSELLRLIAQSVSEECVRLMQFTTPEILEILHPMIDKLVTKRQKLRYVDLPDLMWLTEPYREKEKKQDIFWVARGKKSFA